MQNLTYTAKERAAINTAWNALTYAADCWDWTSPAILRNALKAKEASRPAIEHKANLIGAFQAGVETPIRSAADLYGYQLAWVSILMFGAAYAARKNDDAQQQLPEILAKITAGRVAHDAALARFLNRA